MDSEWSNIMFLGGARLISITINGHKAGWDNYNLHIWQCLAIKLLNLAQPRPLIKFFPMLDKNGLTEAGRSWKLRK